MQTDQDFIASIEALAPHVGTKRIVSDEIGLSVVWRLGPKTVRRRLGHSERATTADHPPTPI